MNGNEAAKTAHSLAHKAGKATARAEKTILERNAAIPKETAAAAIQREAIDSELMAREIKERKNRRKS